jgi:hypothetical protein
MKSVKEVAGVFVEPSTTSSASTEPSATRRAPLVLNECAQPCPAAPLLPQGQGIVWSTPSVSFEQKVEPGSWSLTWIVMASSEVSTSGRAVKLGVTVTVTRSVE